MIAVYNATKKELVGVFRTQAMVCRYIDPLKVSWIASRVQVAVSRKQLIIESRFPFRIALRHATPSQADILGDNDYFMMDGYECPLPSVMDGFHDTRISLAIKHTKHLKHCKLAK